MHVRKNRTGGAAIAAVMVTALALAGCTSGADGDADADGKARTNLRVVIPAEPSSLNPTFLYMTERRFVSQMYDPLVGIDKQQWVADDMVLLPTWERADDLTWDF